MVRRLWRSAKVPARNNNPARPIIAHSASVGTGGGGVMLQGANVMSLLSSVTAPFRASALPPRMFASVFIVMLVSAIRFPMNEVVVPSVAELPIRHATPHGFPPLIKSTDDPLAVVKVLPVLNINVAFGFPCAFNVRVPVNCAEESKQ